tara:strand:+ start:2094 stop:2591 length:498 start_codon:yes stop_codon:yes gene_type:complete
MTNDNNKTSQTKTAIFTMGLPASGKSTVANETYDMAALVVVDPDLFKESHPAYDANDPGALHGWSNERAEELITATFAEGVSDIFIDGTGVNAEKMVRRMNQAKAAGYSTEILYVKVDLAVALQRNAERPRTVPTHVLTEKARDITTSFEIASKHADKVTVIDNN